MMLYADRMVRTAAFGLCLLGAACGGRLASSAVETSVPMERTEGGLTPGHADGDATTRAGPVNDADVVEDRTVEALDGLTEDATVGESPAAPGVEAGLDAPDDALWCGDVQAVPECVAYQALLETCFIMRDVPFACQSAVLPTGDADVAAIKELCLENLNRLAAACR